MITGLDARVDLDHWCATRGESREEQTELYYRIEAGFEARAYIVGRQTMEPYATGQAADPGGDVPARPLHNAPRSDVRLAVVLDPSGKLHWEGGNLDGDHLLMVLGPDVPDGHLRELAARGISYLVSPDRHIDPVWLLEQLAMHFDAKRVLVEGGGVLNGIFLDAGLIDEISLLMIPAMDGTTGHRNLFEVKAPMRSQLSLIEATVLEAQAVHLRYAVHPAT